MRHRTTQRWTGWVVALSLGWAGSAAAGPDDATSAPTDPLEAASSDALPEVAAEGPAAADGVASEAMLVSLDFKDADIRQVLRIIALKAGVDIVAGSDVEGLVTIKLTQVPWPSALDIILRTYGLTYERKGKVIRVMTLSTVEQEPLATEVFPLNYATAKDVPGIINEMLSDRGRVKFDERTNTVIVTDVPSTLFQIERVIGRLDQRTPQVLIETRLVETRLERDENLGIEWQNSVSMSQTAPSISSSFPFQKGSTLGELGANFFPPNVTAPSTFTLGTLTGPTFSLVLNMLKDRTNTKIISNPSLAVLDNHEAKIHIGQEYPVPTFSVDPQTGNTTVSGFQSKTLGTVLTVTPHVNPSREIVVDLKPEVISNDGQASFQISSGNSVTLPIFGTQTVETMVRISNGDTIAIGGLLKTSEVVVEEKVPFLSDLPLVGLLFTNQRRFGGSAGTDTLQQDLLIFLTVSLIEESASPQAVASDVAE